MRDSLVPCEHVAVVMIAAQSPPDPISPKMDRSLAKVKCTNCKKGADVYCVWSLGNPEAMNGMGSLGFHPSSKNANGLPISFLGTHRQIPSDT